MKVTTNRNNDIRQWVFTHKFGVGKATEFPDSGPFIVLSHDVSVQQDHRNTGLGGYYHKERLDWMRDQGTQCVVCTCYDWNHHQISILQKNGWIKVHTLPLKGLSIWVKNL